MKFSLTTKLAFCYFILAVTFFLIINFTMKEYLSNQLSENSTESMSSSGNMLQRSLTEKNLNSVSSTSHIKSTIDAACAVSSYSISYFDYNGTPRYSSCSDKDFAGHYHSKKKYKKALKKEADRATTLNGFFGSEQICTIITVTQYQHPVGYLVMGTPVSAIEEEANSLVSMYSLFLILIYIFLLLVFILLYFMHVYPIQKIIVAAN